MHPSKAIRGPIAGRRNGSQMEKPIKAMAQRKHSRPNAFLSTCAYIPPAKIVLNYSATFHYSHGRSASQRILSVLAKCRRRLVQTAQVSQAPSACMKVAEAAQTPICVAGLVRRHMMDSRKHSISWFKMNDHISSDRKVGSNSIVLITGCLPLSPPEASCLGV